MVGKNDKLLYDTTTIVQEVTLGMDAGSKIVGLSATTRKKVLFEAEVTLRNIPVYSVGY